MLFRSGTCWYGDPLFNVEGKLRSGHNEVSIRYVSILNNYCRSQKDNPMAQLFNIGKRPSLPAGLQGPVTLYE